MLSVGNILISNEVVLSKITQISSKVLQTKILNIFSEEIFQGKQNYVIEIKKDFLKKTLSSLGNKQKQILKEIDLNLNIKNVILTIKTK